MFECTTIANKNKIIRSAFYYFLFHLLVEYAAYVEQKDGFRKLNANMSCIFEEIKLFKYI